MGVGRDDAADVDVAGAVGVDACGGCGAWVGGDAAGAGLEEAGGGLEDAVGTLAAAAGRLGDPA
jgi:hypothetical protein